jgi:vacuolar-type H+-ATPase subunit I/STV1
VTITESIKFDKLQEENEKLKKELAEKDKEIEGRIIKYRDLIVSYEELKSKQLYKEDFKTKFIKYNPTLVKEKYVLKDNSKYDKLLSKDVE